MGRNDVYAYTKAHFGTITGKNNNNINGCRTLVGTLDVVATLLEIVPEFDPINPL